MSTKNELTAEEQAHVDAGRNPDGTEKEIEQQEQQEQKKELTEEERIAALVEARLTPIKEKLTNAFKERDEAKKALEAKAAAERAAEAARLDSEGKHKDAFDIRLAEISTENETLKKENTELKRDGRVRSALSGFTFRSERAAEMAQEDVVKQLVQKDGQWVHPSGMTISDFVKKFAEEESNSFLFKPKTSQGSGADSVKKADTKQTQPKKLTQMSSEELMEHYRKK